ncbi:ATP-binding protein [Hathewaya histolytica]|uniref:histidine kinase n=1 Tax=Hathewaya histolytica TaxID=1498 RepID=A0A4U9RT94_HATHI|nr:ATP-binding protein [Hathewaya histolytica]VTQ95654.1 signal transduction histidine kinase [Hathewaya histolytica]
MINSLGKHQKLKDSRNVLLIAVCVTLVSQIQLYFLVPDFRVSMGIIVFPIALYYFENISTIKTALLTALFVYIWRIILHYITNGSMESVFLAYFPEIFFYLFYGVFFSVLNRKNKDFHLNKLFTNLVISDYLANAIEIILRTPSGIMNFRINISLIVVALIRTLIICVILKIFKLYNVLLLKKEHEEKYRKLLILSSQLKSEVFWMEKNMHHIERTMTEAYKLFENIRANINNDLWEKSALAIAKDIHEIKKEYVLVVRGVRELTYDKFKDEGMDLKDMLYILEKSIKDDSKNREVNVKFNINYQNNFYTTKHYYLMSIFRNLLNNSIDAFNNVDVDNIIYFKQEILNDFYVFIIGDNGSGIEDSDLEFIFSPGYSTKINYTTGEVNRGIGLSLVKEIVEDILGGEIKVKSKKNKGTEFSIYLNREELEDRYEDIHS